MRVQQEEGHIVSTLQTTTPTTQKHASSHTTTLHMGHMGRGPTRAAATRSVFASSLWRWWWSNRPAAASRATNNHDVDEGRAAVCL